MADLLGHGPHSIAADGDYPIKCVRIERPVLLTIGLEFLSACDGDITFESRKRGSGHTYVLQAYVLPDGTVDDAALQADTVVQIDATGKDIQLVMVNRTQGTVEAEFNTDTDL